MTFDLPAVSMFRDARYLPAPQSYQPHVPEEHRVWPFRKALMREYLLSKDADVVCVQEASAETFEADFDFMKDAGWVKRQGPHVC